MFRNREEAGQLLATKLDEYREKKESIVLAIPRGGVVVGREIANHLKLPLSVIVVKKLGAPGNPELAIGAVAPERVKAIDAELALRVGVEQEYLDEEIKRKSEEVEERIKKYQISNIPGLAQRSGAGKYQISDKKIFIITDDGVATGATVLAAIKYVKKSSRFSVLGSRLILAVPVIAKDTYDRLKSEVDELIALEVTDSFGAVGQFYKEFSQVSDEEVVNILNSK